MKDGFIKVAAATPDVRVADVEYNTAQILEQMEQGWENHAKVMVFPEMAVTGYSCNDLFLQRTLINAARAALMRLVGESAGHDMVTVVGLPWMHGNKLYNAAAVFSDGELLGVVPKTYMPNYGEFYEARYFAVPGGKVEYETIVCGDENAGDICDVPFGTDILFCCEAVPELVIAAEICEDLWVPCPPGIAHAQAGATLIVNPSASDELTGKKEYRRTLIESQSAGRLCAYIYASAGIGESTQDVVYSGHDIIAESGTILAESGRFENGVIYAEIDVHKLCAERVRMCTYDEIGESESGYEKVYFSLDMEETQLTRTFPRFPFVPGDSDKRTERCEDVLSIQSFGLRKRLAHTHAKCAVIGLSGGLDSTQALLVTLRAFDSLGLDRKGIIAVTMPCFGTTDRTYNNACRLAQLAGATLREVRIEKAVLQHFADIGHDKDVHDVTYENSQARERTQVLMDIANQEGGLVIGTGDMSELALGWATYNGDHMSMYGVNAGVPKTLIRYLVEYYADSCGDEALAGILRDVLDTPVSPELLPPEDGKISQKTEDLVGPYELHDFFLYYMLRFGYTPSKIRRIAEKTFAGIYDDETIYKWEKNFYRRFFAQQFKRSCLPDGPKIGSVAISPRGDLRMPSDAAAAVWLSELDEEI